MKSRKGFTLIELIVVIAIVGIIVGLATGIYKGYTKEANLTKHLTYVKELESASERYYMSKGDWPRATDEPYTSEQLATYAEKIKDITGQEVNLGIEGKYYSINYQELSKYIKLTEKKENYILQNPVGSIYYLEDLTELGREKLHGKAIEEPGEENNTPELQISILTVGEKVNIAGVSYIVVGKDHYGTDQVTLLSEKVIRTMEFDEGNSNIYNGSDIDLYLEGNFYNGLPRTVRDNIITVEITVEKGHFDRNLNSLYRKVYLLSDDEVEYTTDTVKEGNVLDYFKSGTSAEIINKRKATDTSEVYRWFFLRTPYFNSSSYVRHVNAAGNIGNSTHANNTVGSVRPAFNLKSTTPIETDGTTYLIQTN